MRLPHGTGCDRHRGADVPDQLEGQARAGCPPLPNRSSRYGPPRDRTLTGGIPPVSLREHELRGTRSFPELRLQLLGPLLHRKFRHVAGLLLPPRHGGLPGAPRRGPLSPTGRGSLGSTSVRDGATEIRGAGPERPPMNCPVCGWEHFPAGGGKAAPSADGGGCPYKGAVYKGLRAGHDQIYFGRWRRLDANSIDLRRACHQLERLLREITAALETED